MKIPKSFVLGGVTWEVRYVTSPNAYGMCDFNKHQILLCDDMTKERAEHTFCHELVHAIKFSMGLRDHDEREVDGLATFMHQYFKEHHK